jgi:hypothetical protein
MLDPTEEQARKQELQEWINTKPYADPPYPGEEVCNVLVRKYNKWEERKGGSKFYKKWGSNGCGFARMLTSLGVTLRYYTEGGQTMAAMYQNDNLISRLPKGCKMVHDTPNYPNKGANQQPNAQPYQSRQYLQNGNYQQPNQPKSNIEPQH